MRNFALAVVLFVLGCGGADDTTPPEPTPDSSSTADADANLDTTIVDTATADTGPDATDSGLAETIATDSDATDTTTTDTSATDSSVVESGSDTKSDACTKCGSSACCTSTEICMLGSCIGCGTMLACAGACVDATSDPTNCGACGKACLSSEVCVAGVCSSSCPSGKTACSGYCRDTATDPTNCGACGTTCPSVAGGIATCTAGKCGFDCISGLGDCNKVAGDGCEARLDSHAYCGDCATKCADTDVCSGTCKPGKYVFVTKDKFLPGFGTGGTGADTRCQTAATAAGLPGTYKAWMAVPSSRFTKAGVPYVLTRGAIVANDWADLVDAKLATAISLDEYANSVESTAYAWTDANAAGNSFTPSVNCSGWASASSSLDGQIGKVYATDLTWASQFGWHSQCNNTHHLYCFAQ